MSLISWVFYNSVIESNKYNYLLTALLHISWTIEHSGTNCIVEGWVSTTVSLIFFDSYSIQEQTLMHGASYQLLYYTFYEFCSSQEKNLMSHHFLR